MDFIGSIKILQDSKIMPEENLNIFLRYELHIPALKSLATTRLFLVPLECASPAKFDITFVF